MSRVKGGTSHINRRRKYKKLAKGYRGARRHLYRTMAESVKRGLAYAFRDRKVRKREFRKLWIIRINAALTPYDISYSRFIDALKKSNIVIDRKQLSQIAIFFPQAFQAIVAIALKYRQAA